MTKASANFHTVDPETQRPVFFKIGDPVPDAIAETVGAHVLDEAPDVDVDDDGTGEPDADTDAGTDADTDPGAGPDVDTGTADTVPPVPDYAGQVPTGNIADVLAWVDGDAEKASAALAAEEASDNKPRTTLIDDLNAIIAAAAAADTSSGAAETPTEAGAE